jgi:hypothetical protein
MSTFVRAHWIQQAIKKTLALKEKKYRVYWNMQ